MWSVNEFQIFSLGIPLLPDGSWRMSANPNQWDVQLAFDNSAVTRWRSWDRAQPGMFIEVDFGQPLLIDEVRLVAAPDTARTEVDLQGMNARGEWCPLTVRRSTSSHAVRDNLRQASIRTLVARGIHYLLVTPGAFGANDFNDNPAAWGIELLAESGGRRLYVLKPAAAADPPRDPVAGSRPSAPPADMMIPIRGSA
jgi:hypothetical protein